MMTHEQKTRLGIFLAVSSCVLLVSLAFFLVPKLREAGDYYTINFRDISVNGLFTDSAVKYQGVDIGKVKRIEVNPRDLSSVIVQIKVQKGFPIKTDTTAVLMLAGITGIRFIDLRGGTRGALLLAPRGEIQTGRGLEEQAGDIVTNIETAVNGFNDLLSPENLARIRAFLEKAEKSSTMISRRWSGHAASSSRVGRCNALPRPVCSSGNRSCSSSMISPARWMWKRSDNYGNGYLPKREGRVLLSRIAAHYSAAPTISSCSKMAASKRKGCSPSCSKAVWR